MSISRWMDKKVVLHIHNGILLSYKKECIWVSSDEVDEPRTYYTEWSESGREREISYLNAHIQNLEKWYWRIYLQGSNGEGNGTPLQYSCLENPVDGGAWWAAVHGVAKSRTRLSDVTFTFHFHALEKEIMWNEKAFCLERKKNESSERKMRKHASQEWWLRSRSE